MRRGEIAEDLTSCNNRLCLKQFYNFIYKADDAPCSTVYIGPWSHDEVKTRLLIGQFDGPKKG